MSSVMDVCPLSVIHSCLSRTSYSVSEGNRAASLATCRLQAGHLSLRVLLQKSVQVLLFCEN